MNYGHIRHKHHGGGHERHEDTQYKGYIEDLIRKKQNDPIEFIKTLYSRHGIEGISSSKLRKFYNLIVGIDLDKDNLEKIRNALLKFRILLEYDYNRDKRIRNFHTAMSTYLDTVLLPISNEEELRTKIKEFRDVFEAIIAYSKNK